MRLIDPELFDRRFTLLWRKLAVSQCSLGIDGPVSFHSGIVKREEGYKSDISEKAKRLLYKPDGSLISKEKIVGSVEDLLWKAIRGSNKGDLLLVDHVINANGKMRSNPSEAKTILYDFFSASERDEQEMFKRASDFLGSGYVVSYLFFLKDSDRFFSVRQRSYPDCLRMLKCEIQLSPQLKWEEYQKYLSALREIQELLKLYVNEEITLIDAQSFMFMLYKIENEIKNEQERKKPSWPQEKPENDPPLGPLETRVIGSGFEGAKVVYYTTRYERDRTKREMAIALRKEQCGGRLTCCVCGFDFLDTYGEIGKDFIEVHHLVPLSSYDEEVYVDPKKDLVCLCSNCHSMVHRKRNAVIPPEQLKHLIQRQAENKE